MRKLLARWRIVEHGREISEFTKEELIRITEHFLGEQNLVDAADPLDILHSAFPEFEGREHLASANNAIASVWQALRELKGKA